MKELSGIKVGDKVRASGFGGTIDGVVVQIDAYKGFLVADLEARHGPKWCSLCQLHKI